MLDELREAAAGKADLLTEVAGVMFGLRPDDKNSPHYTGTMPAPSCSLMWPRRPRPTQRCSAGSRRDAGGATTGGSLRHRRAGAGSTRMSQCTVQASTLPS
jgi:hypothetical protein